MPTELSNMPQSVTAAKRVLKEFGYKGLTIDKIEELGPVEGRIYAITPPALMPDGAMRKKAVTLVFLFLDGEVQVTQQDGWNV